MTVTTDDLNHFKDCPLNQQCARCDRIRIEATGRDCDKEQEAIMLYGIGLVDREYLLAQLPARSYLAIKQRMADEQA